MPHKIHRAHPNEEIQREITRAREVIARSLQVLRQSQPDTFLGRPHHELTSHDEDEDDNLTASLLARSR